MKHGLILALAVVALSVGVVRAEQPPRGGVVRENGEVLVRAHVILSAWRPSGAHLDGYTIIALDCAGNVLGSGITDAEGNVAFGIDPVAVVTLRMTGGAQVSAQAVTVQGAGPLYAAFWLQSDFWQPAPVAASWPVAECD